MAVLETIRNKGGVIVSVVIGIALVAFILGDFIPRNGSRNLDVAEIGKKTLTYHDYEQRIAEMTNRYKQSMGQASLDERMMDMVREQAWQFMISGVIAEQEYEKIGLIVSSEELFDLVQGPNPDPMIRQIPDFTDPQTGAFSRSRLMEFLKNKHLYPDVAREWVALEKELLNSRYSRKYDNLVSKGIYVPDFMVNNENFAVNKKVDFDFVVQQYSSIPDSTVKVNNADLKKYYDENKAQWQQNASRDIEYVVFNIVPSDEDRAAADQWIEKIKPDFENAENPQQFVGLNSHVPFDGKFYTQEQLPVQVASLFNADMKEIIGPYQEGETLKLARLAKVENRPDSVKIQQIVIMPKQQTQQASLDAVNLADSIKKAVEGGANFAALALKYSSDPSVQTTNGDIGWIHEMDVQAGSMASQLFSLKKGEVTTMESPQGLFIAQVTERGKEVKKVQVATLQYNIFPSPRTEQLLYAQASKFAIENRTEAKFDEASQQLNKRVATYLGENDRQIPGLSSGRQVIRWAYEAKKGTVSDVFTLDDAYVVAVLKDVRKEGVAPLEQVAAEISVTVQKQKKAQQIFEHLADAAKNASSFSDMALGLGVPVESASEITFSSFSVPGAGIEPKLIAAATTLNEGNISQPVEGTSGVYLVTVKQITEPEEGMVEEAKNRLLTTYGNRSVSESLSALRKAANIKDMRSKFY